MRKGADPEDRRPSFCFSSSVGYSVQAALALANLLLAIDARHRDAGAVLRALQTLRDLHEHGGLEALLELGLAGTVGEAVLAVSGVGSAAVALDDAVATGSASAVANAIEGVVAERRLRLTGGGVAGDLVAVHEVNALAGVVARETSRGADREAVSAAVVDGERGVANFGRSDLAVLANRNVRNVGRAAVGSAGCAGRGSGREERAVAGLAGFEEAVGALLHADLAIRRAVVGISRGRIALLDGRLDIAVAANRELTVCLALGVARGGVAFLARVVLAIAALDVVAGDGGAERLVALAVVSGDSESDVLTGASA